MGKDLKGRELGEGVVQRKNGKYYARYTDSRGKRCEKYFEKPADALPENLGVSQKMG